MPDAPINLANDPLVTSDIAIKLSWEEGLSNGSSSVLNFDVYYDQSSGNWVLLEAEVATMYYTTTVSLTAGNNYSFKVTARNSVGVSLQSD